jgi:hypothetical protein
MAEDSGRMAYGQAGGQAEVTVTSLREDGERPGAPRHGRFWYRVIAGVLLAGLVLAGLAVWGRTQPSLFASLTPARSATPLPQRDPLTVDANTAGMPCVDGAAWSPDSRRFVLAGNTACNGPSGQNDELLATFDARTGAMVTHGIIQWVVVQRELPPPSGTGSWSGARVSYGAPLWSPDGKRIVVPFDVYLPVGLIGPGTKLARHWGLAVLDSALQLVQTLPGQAELVTEGLGSGDNFGPVAVDRWDFSTGTGSSVMVQQALAYAWSPDGTLSSPDLPPTLPATLAPQAATDPIGNPLGGAGFTIWQSGSVDYANGQGCTPSGRPAPDGTGSYYLAFFSTPAWSPDGRYLLLWVSASGRLALAPPVSPTPGPVQSFGCANFGPARQWPQLPIRDAGMRAALGLIKGNIQFSINLAWSPNGRRVAVEPGNVGNGAPALVIYNCASGSEQVHIIVADIVPYLGNGLPFSTMAWSPDGTQLLLVPTGPDPIMHVLGPKSLGG